MTLSQDGHKRQVTATLESLTPTPAASQTIPQGNVAVFGMTLGPIPSQNSDFAKVTGVYVIGIESGSVADEAGLLAGDIILSADRVPVTAPSDLVRTLRDRKDGTPLLLQVRREGLNFFIAIE